jgi:O-antigen/teichoic acid export membrane protein
MLWVLLDKLGLSLLAIGSFFLIASMSTPDMIGQAIFALTGVQLISSMLAVLLEDPLIKRSKYGVNEKLFTLLIVFALIILLFAFYFAVKNLAIFKTDLFLIAAIQGPFVVATAFYNSKGRSLSLFKQISLSSIVGRLVGITTAIIVLFLYNGAFAIVAQATSSVLIQLACLRFFVGKNDSSVELNTRCSLSFSRTFKEIFLLGWSLSLRKLVFDLSSRGVPLILGIVSTAQTVGIYSLAWRVVELLRSSFTTAIQTVFLPKVCQVGISVLDLQNLYKVWLTLVSAVFLPCFFGLAMMSPILFDQILAEKWIGVSEVTQVFCIFAILSLSRSLVAPIRLALGRPQDGLIYEITGTVISLSVMYFFASNAIEAGLCVILRFLIIVPNNIRILKDGIQIGFIAQITPMLPFFLSSLIMAIALKYIGVSFTFEHIVMNIVWLISLGILVYGLLVFIFASNNLKSIFNEF